MNSFMMLKAANKKEKLHLMRGGDKEISHSSNVVCEILCDIRRICTYKSDIRGIDDTRTTWGGSGKRTTRFDLLQSPANL